MPIARQSQETTGAEKNQPRSLWRNRDYLLLVSGQIVSTLGSQFSLIAFPLLALFITGSPAQAGLIGSMRLIPYFLLSLLAGALSDRWDRKRVMQVCDAGRALSLASIPVAFALGRLTLVQLYLVSLIEGTLFVFFDLAEVASMPRVVAREQLVSATSRNEMARNVAFALGPALGGTLYSLGKFFPFLLDAFSYVVSVCTLSWIRGAFHEERSARPQKLWSEIRSGLTWLWRQPLLFFTAVMSLFNNLFFDGIVLLVIVLAQQMHATPLTIGFVLAMDGVGSMFGSFLAEYLQMRLPFRVILMVCEGGWAVFWFMLLLAHNVIVLTVLVALLYVALMLYDINQFIYRRLLIPDELQGRVNSVYRLISYAGAPLGMALTGFLLQAYGPPTTIILIGMGIVILFSVIALNPHLRRARPFSELMRGQTTFVETSLAREFEGSEE